MRARLKAGDILVRNFSMKPEVRRILVSEVVFYAPPDKEITVVLDFIRFGRRTKALIRIVRKLGTGAVVEGAFLAVPVYDKACKRLHHRYRVGLDVNPVLAEISHVKADTLRRESDGTKLVSVLGSDDCLRRHLFCRNYT